MKTIKLVALLLLTASMAVAQNFEGKVIYKNEYKSKIPNVTNEQFNAMMGTNQEYQLKAGNYKSSMDGTLLQWQIYTNKENRLYNKMTNSPVITWYDGAANADEILKSEINKGVITILGYPCDELILTCKNGIEKYYFNSKIKVDPKLYEKHKFGNWSEVLSRTGALPLKMIIDNAQFTLESTATKIEPMKLDDKVFELPAGSKVEKSQH